MNTCYMNKRRKNYFGFNLLKDFVYGTIDGIDYITNGNPKGNKMRIYVHNGNGWMSTTANIRKSKIAQAVIDRYGKVIAEKNAKYKDSGKELADANAWRNRAYGQELGLRKSKPYDANAIDATYQALKACRYERRVGL